MQKHICQVSNAFRKKIILSTSLFSTDIFLFTLDTYVQIQQLICKFAIAKYWKGQEIRTAYGLV